MQGALASLRSNAPAGTILAGSERFLGRQADEIDESEDLRSLDSATESHQPAVACRTRREHLLTLRQKHSQKNHFEKRSCELPSSLVALPGGYGLSASKASLGFIDAAASRPSFLIRPGGCRVYCRARGSMRFMARISSNGSGCDGTVGTRVHRHSPTPTCFTDWRLK